MSTEHVPHTRTHNGSRSVACAFEMLFLILTHCRIKQDVSACVWYFSFADFEASRRLWFPSSWRLYRNVHETQTYRRTSAWTQGDTHTVNAQYNREREGERAEGLLIERNTLGAERSFLFEFAFRFFQLKTEHSNIPQKMAPFDIMELIQMSNSHQVLLPVSH